MQRFDTIGVFLRGLPVDDAVLAFAGKFAKMGAPQLHFIYVHDPKTGSPAGAPLPAEFEARVRAALPNEASAAARFEVRTGSDLLEILKAARDLDMGLIMLGRRLPSNQLGIGSGILRIVRKAPCSVMVIPELCTPHLDRVMVAVDRSRHAVMAMEAAVAIVKASGNPKAQLETVMVRHVVSRPEIAGVTFDEDATAQAEYAKRDMDLFLADINTQGLHVEPVIALSDEPSKAISHVVAARKMDLLVVGSRGATRPTALFLGSKSEGLLMACALPILVVKEKGETLHLIEALFSMD